MSKITNGLMPEDFGRTFDNELFGSWKQSINEHEQYSLISMALFFAGLIAMLALGGVVGIGLFFVLAITGICMNWPKMERRKQLQKQLGISNSDFAKAVAERKRKMNG
jgi:hypothetical protein